MIRCFLLKCTQEVVQSAVFLQPGCAHGEFHRCEVRIRVEAQDKPQITISQADIDALPEFLTCERCNEEIPRAEMDVSKSAAVRWMRCDTGEVKDRIAEFPAGAMWFADWYLNSATGLYGWDWNNQSSPPLIVKTPGGDWDIDSRASNCTMPEDKTHRCWVRHGQPPDITVDKDGVTCAAGAGSILCGSYHGFLRDGHLTL